MNLKMLKEIKAKWNTVVPIGAGKSLFDIRMSGVESETKIKGSYSSWIYGGLF